MVEDDALDELGLEDVEELLLDCELLDDDEDDCEDELWLLLETELDEDELDEDSSVSSRANRNRL